MTGNISLVRYGVPVYEGDNLLVRQLYYNARVKICFAGELQDRINEVAHAIMSALETDGNTEYQIYARYFSEMPEHPKEPGPFPKQGPDPKLLNGHIRALFNKAIEVGDPASWLKCLEAMTKPSSLTSIDRGSLFTRLYYVNGQIYTYQSPPTSQIVTTSQASSDTETDPIADLREMVSESCDDGFDDGSSVINALLNRRIRANQPASACVSEAEEINFMYLTLCRTKQLLPLPFYSLLPMAGEDKTWRVCDSTLPRGVIEKITELVADKKMILENYALRARVIFDELCQTYCQEQEDIFQAVKLICARLDGAGPAFMQKGLHPALVLQTCHILNWASKIQNREDCIRWNAALFYLLALTKADRYCHSSLRDDMLAILTSINTNADEWPSLDDELKVFNDMHERYHSGRARRQDLRSMIRVLREIIQQGRYEGNPEPILRRFDVVERELNGGPWYLGEFQFKLFEFPEALQKTVLKSFSGFEKLSKDSGWNIMARGIAITFRKWKVKYSFVAETQAKIAKFILKYDPREKLSWEGVQKEFEKEEHSLRDLESAVDAFLNLDVCNPNPAYFPDGLQQTILKQMGIKKFDDVNVIAAELKERCTELCKRMRNQMDSYALILSEQEMERLTESMQKTSDDDLYANWEAFFTAFNQIILNRNVSGALADEVALLELGGVNDPEAKANKERRE